MDGKMKYGYYIVIYRRDPHSMFYVMEAYGSLNMVNGFDTEEEAEKAAKLECQKALYELEQEYRYTLFSYDSGKKITEEVRRAIYEEASKYCTSDVLISFRDYPREDVMEIIKKSKDNI